MVEEKLRFLNSHPLAVYSSFHAVYSTDGIWCVCVRAGWPITPTLWCIKKIKEPPCYFLEPAPFFFSPMLIKEEGFSANPQHPTCFYPAFFSLSSSLLSISLYF